MTKFKVLLHPVHNTPHVASVLAYLKNFGRIVGLVVQFDDGHRAALTFDELRQAEAAVDNLTIMEVEDA